MNKNNFLINGKLGKTIGKKQENAAENGRSTGQCS